MEVVEVVEVVVEVEVEVVEVEVEVGWVGCLPEGCRS